MEVERDPVFTLTRYSAQAYTSRLHLTFPAAVDQINPAVERALSFAHRQGCIAEAEFEVRLALQEAIANAVVHGCKHDRDKQVHCLLACDDRELLIVVRDPGNGFDPNKVPCPTDDDRLLEDHGRGVELMRRLMDEVHFERGGSEAHMIKRFRPDNGLNGTGQA